jgi:hypothetical protein
MPPGRLLQQRCYLFATIMLQKLPVEQPVPSPPFPLVALALSGFVLALFGTYWDDAWHTEKGRDTVLAAPHIALYAGISLAGAAITGWAALVARAAGLRAAVLHPPLLLALLGVGVALAAAPVDNGWHLAFGRDAVVWSPPHMLGVAGNLAIAAGLYLALTETGAARAMALVAGAAVLAVAAAPVLEYDTDVPQFDLAFYLPVLAAGAAFALGLVQARDPRPWAATSVALVYTAIMATITIGLHIGDMPGPLVPLIVVPAVALDIARRRQARVPYAALLFAAALFAAYVPYLNWVLSGPFLELGDVAVGLPLAAVAAGVGLTLASLARTPSRSRPRTPGAVATAALIALLLLPATAFAHDPGQGEEVMTADLAGRAAGESARVTVRPEHCRDTASVRLVARRAGEELAAPLTRAGECEFRGRIDLPDRGRWFVYAELRHQDELVETWLPLHSDGEEVRREEGRSVYIPPDVDDPLVKTVAGILVYAFLLGVIAAIPLIARRYRPAPG